ncbi:DEAD/DEAH box helicase family protein, partial [bacterium]|nr:DEAD/DEAH box helicase family protein [bacterium]
MAQYSTIEERQSIRIHGKPQWGVGEVIREFTRGGITQLEVVFNTMEGRQLRTVPKDKTEVIADIWTRLEKGDYDSPKDFLLKQLAIQFPLQNKGGELSNTRTDLLPHQILLTHRVVFAERRHFLIADEVGLGKTIETGMIIRELLSRNKGKRELRILIVCPAGLTVNWQDEMRDAFRIHFDVLGRDFIATNPLAWENHDKVIASIDTIKQPHHKNRLLNGPSWDIAIFDEAHHLSRKQYSGGRIESTQNFQFAEALRTHTEDLLFLTATPHQGDRFQFWSLIQLLDDQLFEGPEDLLDHKGLLNRVMIRRNKKEVTDANGDPIFMRRQVQTQSFQMSMQEYRFYQQLNQYLEEGYGAAGIDQTKTTSNQRAMGFVMTTFQKIMASSLFAIRQALHRRLLGLLARAQITLEHRLDRKPGDAKIAQEIVRKTEEMRKLVVTILKIQPSVTWKEEADRYITQVRQSIASRGSRSEITQWALEDMEQDDSVMIGQAQIPNEIEKLRRLIDSVPNVTDRKFDTLVRAVESIRRENPGEKFVIFTQYLETQKFLVEKLGEIYNPKEITVIRGGSLDDKIAAKEAFWDDEGPHFLISTSAGGEGINLQNCSVLFNYDLPWNPMAVEQRIGRIHRYGQQETVQVYNLVAEGTVEDRVYSILENKLSEIAQSIGKVDSITGDVNEDFRSEILGLMSSLTNYQDLYRRALVYKDYKRTEAEIAEAMKNAREATDALKELAQDMDTFNLEHYRELKGCFHPADLKNYCGLAIIHLGGMFVDEGDFCKIQVPDQLMPFPNVSALYEKATFDRSVAMRSRQAEFMGLGHPLIDAIIEYFSTREKGVIAQLNSHPMNIQIRIEVEVGLDDDDSVRFYHIVSFDEEGNVINLPPDVDLNYIKRIPKTPGIGIFGSRIKLIRQRLE